jgi:hypothetical protein
MNQTIQGLAAPLQSILDAELACGNTVAEVANWPPKCELLVILRRPFHRTYLPLPDVEFAEINDIHYWKSEYQYKESRQVIACKFG